MGIHAGFVSLPCAGGAGAYYAVPDDAVADTPAIVLAMHLYGLDLPIREAVRRFSEAGFVTIAPDFYWRWDVPKGDGSTDHTKFVPFARQLEPAAVDADIDAALSQIKAQFSRSKVAIAGFCMGGVIAMRRCAGYSHNFAAAAVWYGLTDMDPALVDIPVVASYGSNDPGIPIASVNAFENGLTVPHDFKIYPDAGHAFCDSQRESYNVAAAVDSWQRTITFLRRVLSPER
jgi:carboxymethylenebutenolidase